MAKISYGISFKKAYSDYSSKGVNIVLEDDVKKGETVEKAYDRIKKRVDQWKKLELDTLEFGDGLTKAREEASTESSESDSISFGVSSDSNPVSEEAETVIKVDDEDSDFEEPTTSIINKEEGIKSDESKVESSGDLDELKNKYNINKLKR